MIPKVERYANGEEMLNIRWKSRSLPTLTEHCLSAHDHPGRGLPFLIAFYRWSNWGTEKSSHWPPCVAQRVNFGEKTQGSLMRVRALEAIREALA